MQHFKSFKSYISNNLPLSNKNDTNVASSSTLTSSMSETIRIAEFSSSSNNEKVDSMMSNTQAGSVKFEMVDSTSMNSKFQKSLNDSTKRFTNFIQFRRSLAVKSNKPISCRPKFLSSKASYSTKKRVSLESSNLNDFNGNLSHKKQLLYCNELRSELLFDWLENEINELIKHFQQIDLNEDNVNTNSLNFMETSEVSSYVYFKLATHAKYLMLNCSKLYQEIEKNAHKYDFDENLKANGYRSLLRVYESCCRRLLKVVTELNEKKSGFLFQFKLMNTNLPIQMNSYLKELQIWLKLMEKIETLLTVAVDMQLTTLNKTEKSPMSSSSSFSLSSNVDVTTVIKPFHDGASLYLHSDQFIGTEMETNVIKLSSIYLDAFFGRACGFQFCDSLQMPLTGCAVALASYNDGYEAFSNKENSFQSSLQNSSNLANSPSQQIISNGSPISQTTNNNNSLTNSLGQAVTSLFSSTKYIMDPDLRAKKMSHVMKNANVEFCKAFWQLTELSIVQMGSNLISPALAVNVVKRINLGAVLRVPDPESPNEFIDIQPPTGSTANETIKIRILSNEMRHGMQDLDKLQTIESPVSFNIQQTQNLSQFGSNTAGVSKYLILHAHGGGFIAQSSKSHEIYLKPWCKELKVPIVSIDYSLAPEANFPRASEEVFYVYAWCLLNKNLLGWSGEKIICVGDSAGGVLVTNIVQRAIVNKIRIPDALVPIYAPFLCTYSLSPSRLLSVMDPLLNIGILWRCLAAYCGIDFKTESEKYKNMLNIDDSGVAINSDSIESPTSKLKREFSIKYSKSSDSEDLAISADATTDASHDNAINNLDKSIPDDTNVTTANSLADDSVFQELASPNEAERLLVLHKLMGDSIFLIEKLRFHKSPLSQYMSPLLSEDSVISKFPKTCLIAASDPFLDDNIEMAKRLRNMNVNAEILIVDNGTPHGFLNMKNLSEETKESFEEVLSHLKEIIDQFEIESQDLVSSTNIENINSVSNEEI